MTLDEIASLLKVLAAYDGRNVGEADFMVWNRQMSEVDFPDAVEAIHQHYAEAGSDWAKPGHVRTRAEKIRNARNRRPEVIAPGCFEPEPDERLRLGADQGPRALPGKLEDDLARDIRMEPGAARCQDVLSQIMARLEANRCAGPEPSESDLRLQRARQRAAAERRVRN